MPDRGGALARLIVLISAVVLSGCQRGEPAVDRTPLVVGGKLQVRRLVTGYEGERTAPASAVTPLPLTAIDAPTWAAMWARANLQPPAPNIAFDREMGVLHGFPRGSCTANRSRIDSARLDAEDSVRLFVSSRTPGICVDTTSFSVVAGALRRSPRWTAPPHIVVIRYPF